MSGKIHPKKPVTHAVGPTYTVNDPAKFSGAGKSKGKTMSNGVVDHAKGATYTANTTPIKMGNADKPAKSSKSMGEKSWFDPHSSNTSVKQRTATQDGSGSPTTPAYPLKKEYRK